jgi:RHS repeat-associated protein
VAVYGLDGELIAEYEGSSGNLKKEYAAGGGTLITIEPTAVNSNGTQYNTGDHLGSPRVITNSSGSVMSRHDYKPFGEELGSGTGGRTTGMGFNNSGDNNRKKFTGYERDSETGLDFAQARYYANLQGRFTRPDPFSGSATTTNPQTFNRYAYVGNNPTIRSDPSGLAAHAAMMSTSGDINAMFRGHDSSNDIAEAEADYEDRLAGKRDYIVLTVQPIDGALEEAQTASGSSQPQKPSPPPPNPCEQRLGKMFGDPGAVMRTTYDFNGGYRGRNPQAAAKFSRNERGDMGNKFFDSEHLFNFPHLSGNLAGTATTNIYIPSNYVQGTITKPTKDDNIVTAYYKRFGTEKDVTLAIFHVADYGVRNVAGRLRIGTTGGLGGNSNGVNMHSHFELWRGRGYRPPGPSRDAARIPFTPVFCP